jgi:hypothetical protein
MWLLKASILLSLQLLLTELLSSAAGEDLAVTRSDTGAAKPIRRSITRGESLYILTVHDVPCPLLNRGSNTPASIYLFFNLVTYQALSVCHTLG